LHICELHFFANYSFKLPFTGPQAVPNEILTAFKEHYFKLQEPLTTFKLYKVLTKVFLYVATGNLAVSNGMVSGQSELSTNGLLGMVLPPNSCFETAFTSDNPVTRIVPQRCVDTLHFSQHTQQIKSVSLKRMSSAPNLYEPLQNIQATQKGSRQSGTKRQIIGGKRAVKMASRKGGRRVRIGVEEDRKLYHFRSKSGGYVNPALSKSIEDTDTDDFIDTGKIQAQYNIDPEQELDYVAALESLNTLMRCSRRDNPSVAVSIFWFYSKKLIATISKYERHCLKKNCKSYKLGAILGSTNVFPPTGMPHH